MSNNFISHLEDPSHPFILCDNWFTPEEEKSVWNELDYYINLNTLQHSSLGPVATDEEGTDLASNFRVYPDRIYKDESRNTSPILSGLSKLSDTKLHSFIHENMLPGPFNNYKGTNCDSTIISYYHTGDYYKSHYDAFQFTILIWLYKEPKAFTGGDFHFTDAKISVPCVNNRLIIFPSFLNHAVTSLEFETKKPIGFGRYTLTHFFYTIPQVIEEKDNNI